jgi:hypothetical protein
VGAPAAWCAAFASWCVEERLERKLGTATPVKEAGALNLGRLFPATRNPQPGDLMYFATGGGKGHVGIVIAVDETEVLCIEGNSQNRVRYVRRLRSEVLFSSTRVEAAGPETTLVKPWPEAPLAHVTIEGTR